MSTLRRKLTLALIAALLWVAPPVHAAECSETELKITGYQVNGNELHLAVNNPTSEELSGILLIVYEIDGEAWMVAWGITVPAQTTVTVDLAFVSAITLISVDVCGDSPDGVQENPDPVPYRGKGNGPF